jgi:hypothetical protein
MKRLHAGEGWTCHKIHALLGLRHDMGNPWVYFVVPIPANTVPPAGTGTVPIASSWGLPENPRVCSKPAVIMRVSRDKS